MPVSLSGRRDMGNFISWPSRQTLSGKHIAVPYKDTIQIGIYGCHEGIDPKQAPLLGLKAGDQINAKIVKDDGTFGVVHILGKAAGTTTLQLVASNGAVWDKLTVTVNADSNKPAPIGHIPIRVIDAAILSHATWGIPVSVVLAQWSVESNWGTQMPAGSNNPFGIKAAGGQASVHATTQEEANGKKSTIVAPFRKFTSLAEAFNEHGRLLATNYHYVQAMSFKDDPDKFADALTGVYATGSNYGSVLRSRMQTYNLYRYDDDGESKGIETRN
jgi:hypothetical protein